MTETTEQLQTVYVLKRRRSGETTLFADLQAAIETAVRLTSHRLPIYDLTITKEAEITWSHQADYTDSISIMPTKLHWKSTQRLEDFEAGAEEKKAA